MRIVVTGAAGLMGTALVQVGRERGDTVVPLSRNEADITDPAAVDRAIRDASPDWVVHAAAIPDPDICETNPALAYAVNTGGTESVARASRASKARMAHISTDSVFEGERGVASSESDESNPINVYGRTKLAAEVAAESVGNALLARISVLFGPAGSKGPDSVFKAIAKASRGEKVAAASDQISTATYTLDAARIIYRALEMGETGPLHICNAGTCSRYELIREALQLARLDPELAHPISMDDMKRPARRARYAALSTARLVELGFDPPRPWQDALAEHIRINHR